MDFGGSVQYSIFAYVVMAVIAMLTAVMVQGIVMILQRSRKKKAEAVATQISVSVRPAVDETAAHVAAVAAAVYTILGAHRLVRIHEVPRGPGWTATGRLAHHTSHLPRRTGH